MLTHSGIPAWKVPRTKKPAGLQFMRVDAELDMTEHARQRALKETTLSGRTELPLLRDFITTAGHAHSCYSVSENS